MLFLKNPCFGYTLMETDNLSLSLGMYLRKDAVAFKNVTDLDSSNNDDSTAYLGIDYSFSLGLKYKKEGPEFYLKLERNGPSDYGAPLSVHNTLVTSGGAIEEYRNHELLPGLEEFWLDTPLFSRSRLKIGLYAYEVGNGFALNGAFENYGITLYRKNENCTWRLYYCRPDLVFKNHLGPRIRQDEEQGVDYNHGAANFFAVDFKLDKGSSFYQPYMGVLTDYTSPGKRDNIFTTPIKRDILGTAGLFWKIKQDKFSLEAEFSHNFGRAKSADAAYKDITHAGYLFYGGIDYYLKKFTPSLQFLFCSGNKTNEEMAQNLDTTLTSAKNRSFSCNSPLNNNLGDSVASVHSDIRPIVAMGSGFGLNYGIPRPGTFAASDFDNIIINSLGFDFNATEKLCIGLYGYYLKSAEKPIGMLNGQPKYLSKDLGRELDLLIDYKFNENILISFLGGYFFPGKYYKEERDDTTGSLFSPYLSASGNADCAYQVELAVELNF